MADTLVSLDKWRDYFRSSNSDIFNVIEHAILVASFDHPYDFKSKRDRIAEMLFISPQNKCFGCNRIQCVVTDDGDRSRIGMGESKDTKESNVNCSKGDDNAEVVEKNRNCLSNFSYGDAEALTDEIEEESQVFEEVLRIKHILDNNEQETDEGLFDSLRRLQLMPLSLETLKATDIGKSVKVLQKHGSKEIRNLVMALTEDWIILVETWMNATTAIADAEVETGSVKRSDVELEEEEEGLPSPPMDEGAFFTTPTSLELSQFFDGMDDDGNPGNSGEGYPKQANDRKPISGKNNVPELKRNQDATLKKRAPFHKPVGVQNGESQLIKPKPCSREPGLTKPRPHSSESRLTKPKPQSNEPRLARENGPSDRSGPMERKLAVKSRIQNESKVQQKLDKSTIQKEPMLPKQKLDFNNEASVRMKLEVAKRKLQERYQEAKNAKKQKTIQVVELQDLPKKSFVQRNRQHTKPGNYNRNMPNGKFSV